MSELDISFESVAAREPAIELTAETAADWSIASPFSLPRLVESFASFAQHGGLSGSSHPPTLSSAVIKSSRIVDRTAKWLFLMKHCDPGAARVLYNLVVFCHSLVSPINRASIRTSLSTGMPALPLGHFERLPFNVNVAVDSDEASVCITFASEPVANTTVEVNSLLKAWLYVAGAGGFSADDLPRDRPLLIPEEEPEWVVDEGWLRLAEVGVDDSAFGPLLNALVGIHARIAPIRSVQIE